MKTALSLRKMYWVAAILGWWMPTMVYGQTEELPECFNSTVLLFEAMLRGNSFIAQTYIVCPNTRLQIGFFRQDGSCCDGEAPLVLRSRSVVKCGESGESSNNCTLVGGQAHVFFVGSYFSDALAQDVRVEGFTFEQAEFISVAIGNRGDITFKNCIWQENENSAVAFVAYAGPDDDGDARRLSDTEDLQAQNSTNGFFEEWVNKKMQQALALQTMPALPGHHPDEHNRGLQVPFLCFTTFENCQFINNKQGLVVASGIPLLGVVNIIAPFNPTTIRDCTFRGNLFDGSDGQPNGYAVQSLGADLTIERTCFFDNSFIGFGPVQAFAGAPLTLEDTFTTPDDLVYCEFAATSDSPVPTSVNDLVCIEKDSEVCDFEVPAEGAPTKSPTNDPPATDPPTTEPPAPASGAVSTLRSGTLLSLSAGLWVYLLAIRL
mmetsp:Transcript_14894/g.28199  ORF Transcript_14894/g.28199 Transcript_14894/m.28199 type:complete len:433 (-) Transcript_14894:280-1578(-)